MYDFTETIRFDLDGNEMIHVPDGGQLGGGDGGQTLDPKCVEFELLTEGDTFRR